MSSTNKTTHYELSQYIGTDKPTYLGDYNSDMVKIDAALHTASDNASTAVSTANSASSTASDAATAASAATTTANNAASTANLAKTTAETASTNASAALTAAQGAQTAAAANTITNLAPAYDPTLTYSVGDLVTFIDDLGSGKLYKCIVDIDVPEAFNINKWDDVTASEAFIEADTATYTYSAGTTYSDIIAGIFSTISALNKMPKRLERYEGTSIRFYSVGLSSNGTLEIVSIRSEAGIVILQTATHITSQNRDNWHLFDISSNGITLKDDSNNTVTVDGYFKIYFE